MPTRFPIIDGHNDALERIYLAQRRGIDPVALFLEGSDEGHLDLRRARIGGMAAGFFAIYVPDDLNREPMRGPAPERATRPPEPAIDHDYACEHAEAMRDILLALEERSNEQVHLIRKKKDLDASLEESGPLGAIMHLEGAEAIKPDLSNLDEWYDTGLRSLGLVWSRQNAFAHGVPFRYPSSPDTGPGLTDSGKNLVRACNEKGIMIDCSHLNERGFWDVEKLSAAPIVATHCGAHAICPSARNLTDAQLDAIAESKGVVGVNFYVGDLRPDGRSDPDTPIDPLLNTIEYMVSRMGIDHVALGSDFDGATMSRDVPDVSQLPMLIDKLRTRTWHDEDITKLTCGNWKRALKAAWK